MTKVQICIEVDETDYTHYELEAENRGVTVKELLEEMVNGLIRELEQEERDGTDFEITP